MVTDPDIVKIVADELVARFPGWTVDTQIPGELPESDLPLIVITEQPGAVADTAWNQTTGPVAEWASLDIDLFGFDIRSLKSAARDVSRMLYSMVRGSNPITTVRNPSTFARRPDWNNRINRVGGEFDFRFNL